jgi:hypothetical protein
MDPKIPKLDLTKLTPEQRAQLDAHNQAKAQLTALQDIADMTQETLSLLEKNDPNANLEKMGALLVDMRGALRGLEAKEAPEQPDIAQPVVDAISKLEKALKAAVSAQKAPVVNVPKADAPVVHVDAPTVDLTKIEKVLKTDLPKAFQQAVQSIAIPKNDNTSILQALSDLNEQLASIDTAVRMQPQAPAQIKVTNPDGSLISSGGASAAVYATNDIEEDTTSYFGQTTSDGTWKIIKLTDTSVSYATVTNNGTVTSYTDAWTDRATLTYGRFDEAF